MRMARARQRGIAILVLLGLFMAAATTTLVALVSINDRDTARQLRDAGRLERAQQALVGFALAHAVPGTLPCPDVDGDGVEDPAGSDCGSQLGLLPWRTLNLDRSLDTSGAFIFYAVETNLVDTAVLRNPSTVTSLTLDGRAMAAVILAPGAPFDGQSRTSLAPGGFLEGINADANLADYQSFTDASGNDQALGLSTSTLWTLVQRRATGESERLLAAYRSACGEYPFAAAFGGPYDSIASQQSGAIAFDSALPFDWGAACPFGTAPVPPAWLSLNWRGELLYRMCLVAEGNCLTVTGPATSPASAVVVAPGVSLAGQARPSADVAQYFELDNASAPDTLFTSMMPADFSSTFNDDCHAF